MDLKREPAAEVPPHQAATLKSLDEATTLLEAFFWGMVLGYPHADEQYLDELMITDLGGDGNVPDNDDWQDS